MTGEPEDHALLFALCHEMGNLVGAIRLQTHLLDQEMSPRDLVTARSEIDVLSARVSALLALVRPVEQLPTALPGEGLDPAQVIAVVDHGIDPLGAPGVDVVFEAVEPGSRIQLDRNALQALITSFVYLAIEQARPRGRVRVGVERVEGRVEIFVEDDGGLDASLETWRDDPLRGRTLLCAVASHVFGDVGGTLAVSSTAEGSRVAIGAPDTEVG